MGMIAEAQFHVLAVDDSLIDRKLIERLLKTSSYQGRLIFICFPFFVFFVNWVQFFLVGSLRFWVLKLLGIHFFWVFFFSFSYCCWFRKQSFRISGFDWRRWSTARRCKWYSLCFPKKSKSSAGFGSESDNYRLLYAWNDWLWFAKKD